MTVTRRDQFDDHVVEKSVLAKAEELARRAHADQKEESTGDPYEKHLERVAGFVFTDAAKIVAWLHDILEDTPLTADDLADAGIPLPLVASIVVLTRRIDETYVQYIDRILISEDRLAVEVKLADLYDHLRPNCPERLFPRYVRALQILKGG